MYARRLLTCFFASALLLFTLPVLPVKLIAGEIPPTWSGTLPATDVAFERQTFDIPLEHSKTPKKGKLSIELPAGWRMQKNGVDVTFDLINDQIKMGKTCRSFSFQSTTYNGKPIPELGAEKITYSSKHNFSAGSFSVERLYGNRYPGNKDLKFMAITMTRGPIRINFSAEGLSKDIEPFVAILDRVAQSVKIDGEGIPGMPSSGSAQNNTSTTIPSSSKVADTAKIQSPSSPPVVDVPPPSYNPLSPKLPDHISSVNADTVGPSEQVGADGNPDTRICVVIKNPGDVIVSAELRNLNGEMAVWDTIPNNGMWALGVNSLEMTTGKSMVKILNVTDSSMVPFSMSGDEALLEFRVQDSGAIAGKKTDFILNLKLANGKTVSIPLPANSLNAGLVGTGGGTSSSGSGSAISTSASAFLPFASPIDEMTAGESFQSNGQPDGRIRASISKPGATIVSMVVNNVGAVHSQWDTIPANGMWLLGVNVIKNDGGVAKLVRLNGPDGALIPYQLNNGSTEFELRVNDNGTIAAKSTDFQLTVNFSDGTNTIIPIAR